MTKNNKSLVLSIALGVALSLAAPGAFAGERAVQKDLTEMARDASSPADHAKVARQYLDRAEALTAKADKLEQELRASEGNKTAMHQKWPGLMNAARDKKERTAMQARRAAQESHNLALHHSRLAGRTLEEIAALD